MKKCVQCGAENRSDFKYCKLCGAELPCVDQKVCREYDPEREEPEFSADSEDISLKEMSVFVGKNSNDIVSRFAALEQNGKKACFCLPAFLFGLFFGLPGAAIWFLYRKMKKTGAILLLISVAMSVISLIFTFSVQCEYYSQLFTDMDYYGRLFALNPAEAVSWLSNYINQLTYNISASLTAAIPPVVRFFTGYFANFAVPIILSFFAISIYKDYSLEKISDIKRGSKTYGIYTHKLKTQGGTSVAAPILGIIIYLIISGIISLIPLLAVVV